MRFWIACPGGSSTGTPMASFNDLRKVRITKGSKDSDEVATRRGPFQTRPLGPRTREQKIDWRCVRPLE
eukprot:2971089-Pyramimonas_sp.AAC.1